MKKSNKLILLTILIFIGSLLFYNFKLKEVYDGKIYKNRFNEMDFTSLKGISVVDVQSANWINLKVEYGTEEGLWIANSVRKDIKFSVSGSKLTLNYIWESEGRKGIYDQPSLILITRAIDRVTASHDVEKPDKFSQSYIRLKGFSLSKLELRIAADTQFYLDSMEIDTLNAKVGGDNYANNAELYMLNSSKINESIMDIGINGVVNTQGKKTIKTSSVKAQF